MDISGVTDWPGWSGPYRYNIGINIRGASASVKPYNLEITYYYQQSPRSNLTLVSITHCTIICTNSAYTFTNNTLTLKLWPGTSDMATNGSLNPLTYTVTGSCRSGSPLLLDFNDQWYCFSGSSTNILSYVELTNAQTSTYCPYLNKTSWTASFPSIKRIYPYAVYYNDNGTWRKSKAVYYNDNGTWRKAKAVYYNDNGTWRKAKEWS